MKTVYRNLIVAGSVLAPILVGWLRGSGDVSGLTSTVGLVVGIAFAIIIGVIGSLTAFFLRKRPGEYYSLIVYGGLSAAACMFLLLTR